MSVTTVIKTPSTNITENSNMVLKFFVSKQKLSRYDHFTPVENSENYLYVSFEFSKEFGGEEWNTLLKKKVIFRPVNSNNDYSEEVEVYLDENSMALVPSSIIHCCEFELYLVGEDNTNGEVVITTNAITIEVEHNDDYWNIDDENSKDLIKVVVGDTLVRYFKITGLADIAEVRFICNKLGIDKELLYDEEQNLYKLLISSIETSLFKPCATDYDIKVIGADGSVYTGKYRIRFKVLPNVNHRGELNE